MKKETETMNKVVFAVMKEGENEYSSILKPNLSVEECVDILTTAFANIIDSNFNDEDQVEAFFELAAVSGRQYMVHRAKERVAKEMHKEMNNIKIKIEI